jgi:hypothetical protein
MKRGVPVSAVALAALLGKLPAEAMPAELLGNVATAAVNGTVPIAVASLARQGSTDLFLARVKELVPWRRQQPSRRWQCSLVARLGSSLAARVGGASPGD